MRMMFIYKSSKSNTIYKPSMPKHSKQILVALRNRWPLYAYTTNNMIVPQWQQSYFLVNSLNIFCRVVGHIIKETSIK